jgi:hypothetical protein
MIATTSVVHERKGESRRRNVQNNFQRVGSISNAHVGNEFEELVLTFFAGQGLSLSRGFSVPVGAGTIKKSRKFDFGSYDPPVLVECKSHAWTSGGNVPSAKLTV